MTQWRFTWLFVESCRVARVKLHGRHQRALFPSADAASSAVRRDLVSIRSVVLSLCVICALSDACQSRAAPPQVEVMAKTAKVRVRKETIATVKKGETYRLLKTQGPWVAIAIVEGEKQKRGWILASAVKLVADPTVTEDST